MNVKFSAIIISNVFPFPDLNSPFFFDNETFALKGPLKNILDTQGNQHWEKWLGSLFWETFNSDRSLILISLKGSERADVVGDAENTALSNRVNNLYSTLLLSGPWKNDARSAYVLSGGATFSKGSFKIERIGEVGTLNVWKHSHYYDHLKTKDEIWKWQVSALKHPPILDRWKNNFLALEQVVGGGANTFLIRLGVLALHTGLHDGLLDFRIPNLVRSIESIVALPASKGKVEFSKRAKQLLTSSWSLPLGVNLTTIGPILEESYQVRSDCVHGKSFAETLRAKLGASFEDELPKYELGLEMVARAVLERAIGDTKIISASSSRANLEDAWAKGNIP